MAETANIDLARRMLAAFAAGDEQDLNALVDRSYRDHARGGLVVGPDGLRETLRSLRRSFAERRIEVQDLIAADDRIVARVRFSATRPDGPGRVQAEHVHIWRVAGDRLAEHWMVGDDLTELRMEVLR